MTLTKWGALASLALTSSATLGAAEPADDALRARIHALEQQVLELKELLNHQAAPPSPVIEELIDQKIRVHERRREIEAEARGGPKPPILSVGERGFSVQSPDGDFLLRLRGLAQADGRFFINDGDVEGNDTFLIRRARIELTGTLFDAFDFRIMPEFAGSGTTLLDAWVDWKIDPTFNVLVGKVKLPVGLERAQAPENSLFNEFGYVTSLVPNRDVGVVFHGDLFNKTVEYYIGAFDGTDDGGSTIVDTDDDKSLAGRLFFKPFANSENKALRGLGFGVGGTWGDDTGTPAGYRSVGQQTMFRWNNGVENDGTLWRIVPQLYYYNGPFGLLAEYGISTQELRVNGDRDTLTTEAWQVSASWVLTGEDATFRGVRPKKPVRFTGDRGWGAWQVAARVSGIDFDEDAFPLYADPDRSASSALTYGAGLNWYLNSMVRISADYNFTEFSGGALPDEQTIITRFQVRF